MDPARIFDPSPENRFPSPGKGVRRVSGDRSQVPTTVNRPAGRTSQKLPVKRPQRPSRIFQTFNSYPPPMPDGLGPVGAAVWRGTWQALDEEKGPSRTCPVVFLWGSGPDSQYDPPISDVPPPRPTASWTRTGEGGVETEDPTVGCLQDVRSQDA